MALREKVLKKKAQKFENKDLERITINKNQLFILERLLSDAYIIRRPKPNEYEHRKQLIRVFNEIAKELYGNDANCPVVEEFGSFSMDLFTTGSDLDLSINFKNSSNQLVFPRDQKIKTLRKFARKFYALQNQGYVRGVQPIVTAKVPILKVTDVGTEVECDLSVENRDGISKSAIIRLITSIDERFQKLSFLMKAWAKAHDINSSKDRTLNSLSIILLVAFHLQTRDPPILPPFSAILKGGHDLESVQTSVRNFRNYGSKNTETLGELFVSFLLKLSSVKILWPKGLCASPFSGHWISKTWDTKIASMSVEDFTDRTQNVARAVGKSEVEEIYRCINLTIQNLGLFMNSQISQLQLNKSFFGIDIMPHYPIDPKPNIPQQNYQQVKTTINPKPNVPQQNYQQVKTTINPKPNVPQQNYQQVKTTINPKPNILQQNYQQVTTPNPILTINPNPNSVIDLNWPPPTGHWPVQPVDHHPNKRMRVPEGVGGWGPGWVEPGWNQGWGATRGAGPQEIQNVEDSWGRRVQRPHNGNYSTYDDLIVESRVSSVSKCWCVSGLLLLALCLVVIAVYN